MLNLGKIKRLNLSQFQGVYNVAYTKNNSRN